MNASRLPLAEPSTAIANETAPESGRFEAQLSIGDVVDGVSIHRAELWRNQDGRHEYRLRIRNDRDSAVIAMALEFKIEGLECSQGIRGATLTGGSIIQELNSFEMAVPSSFVSKDETTGENSPRIAMSVRYVQRRDGTFAGIGQDADKGLRLSVRRAAILARSLMAILSSAANDRTAIAKLEQIQVETVDDRETLRGFLELARFRGRLAALESAQSLAQMQVQ
jgi:hypothetical protein